MLDLRFPSPPKRLPFLSRPPARAYKAPQEQDISGGSKKRWEDFDTGSESSEPSTTYSIAYTSEKEIRCGLDWRARDFDSSHHNTGTELPLSGQVIDNLLSRGTVPRSGPRGAESCSIGSKAKLPAPLIDLTRSRPTAPRTTSQLPQTSSPIQLRDATATPTMLDEWYAWADRSLADQPILSESLIKPAAEWAEDGGDDDVSPSTAESEAKTASMTQHRTDEHGTVLIRASIATSPPMRVRALVDAFERCLPHTPTAAVWSELNLPGMSPLEAATHRPVHSRLGTSSKSAAHDQADGRGVKGHVREAQLAWLACAIDGSAMNDDAVHVNELKFESPVWKEADAEVVSQPLRQAAGGTEQAPSRQQASSFRPIALEQGLRSHSSACRRTRRPATPSLRLYIQARMARRSDDAELVGVSTLRKTMRPSSRPNTPGLDARNAKRLEAAMSAHSRFSPR